MKSGWQIRPLGEVCTFQRGLTYSKSDEVEAGGTAVLRANNIDLETGELDLSEIRFIRSEVAVPASKLVEAGALLICTASGSKRHLGKTALIDQPMDFAFGGFMGLVKPSNGLLPKYLFWLTRSDAYWTFIDALSDGANINNLKFSQLSDFPVPLPPLEEQRRIVAILGEAFEGLSRARANAEANLQSARELFSDAIVSEFGKVAPALLKPIGAVAVHSLGKMLDKSKNKGTPRSYLRNLNVRWFSVDTSNLLEMRIEDREIDRYSVKKGDLLICEGGYPGRSAIWEENDEIFFQKALHRVRFEHEAYGRLLMYYLYMMDQSGALQEHFSGTGIQHFTGQALAKFEMPFPNLSTATDMIGRIQAMQQKSIELEELYARKLNELDELRQSLLLKAFAGELTVKEFA